MIRRLLLAVVPIVWLACAGATGPSSSDPTDAGAQGDASSSGPGSPASDDAATPPSPMDASAEGGDASSGDPAATGLEGFCQHAIDCGSKTYASVKSCVDASVATWGACRRTELDTFGTCMMSDPCSKWDPDAYNPSDTPCAAEWDALTKAPCP